VEAEEPTWRQRLADLDVRAVPDDVEQRRGRAVTLGGDNLGLVRLR
jgi:hypothetical protein